MTYPSWKKAVSAIHREIAPCNDQEKALASALQMQLPATLPRIVAGARMQSELASWFGGTTRTVSEGQQEFLDTLAQEASLEAPRPVSSAEAQSWVEFFFLTRRLKVLRKLRLNKGDIVSRISSPDELDEVVSIGDTGAVYFTGGRSRAWPDQLTVVCRAGESSAASRRSQRIAANRASERSISSLWSEAKQASLEAYKVSADLCDSDIDHLRGVIESARDEKPIQELIQQRPQLLASLVRGPWRYCVPKPSLGGIYIPDFLLAEVDSNGVTWTLVELETPESRVTLTRGNSLDRYARKGVDQINEWRQWLQDNLDQARRSRTESGLGLPDIRPQAKGIVLVGRRYRLRENVRNIRSQLSENQMIEMHTYDWLLEKLDGTLGFQGPWAMNQYAL